MYPAFFWYIMATMPATCGAAMLVPCFAIVPFVVPLWAAMIDSPGASRSGFARPSRVGPSALNELNVPVIDPSATNDPTLIAPEAVAGSASVVRYEGTVNVALSVVTHASHVPVLDARAKDVRSNSTDQSGSAGAMPVNVTVAWQRLLLVEAETQFDIEMVAPARL